MTPEERRIYQRAYYKKRKEQEGSYYSETRQTYYANNKDSFAIRSKGWYTDPTNKMKRRQKIHKVDFERMRLEQKGLCSIGGELLPQKDSDIHVDHDHETGLVRGLACRPHNVGLGMFSDDYNLLIRAAEYIIKHKIRFYKEEEWRRNHE